MHGQPRGGPDRGPGERASTASRRCEHEPRIQQLSDDLEKQGLHPFHLPIGVNLTQDEHGRATHDSVCIRCDRVDGFPCLVNAQVRRPGDLRRPGAGARRTSELVTERPRACGWRPTRPGRTVTQVVTELGDGSTVDFSADVVVVACGAVNSAVLLLRSANDRHPHGLANSSDVVGRHYMRHNNLALMAVSKEPNPTRFQKTLAMNDWYFGADDWDYPLGGIQMLGKSDAEQVRSGAPRWAGKVSPEMPFEVIAHHAVDFWLCGEDLPLPDNRVTAATGTAASTSPSTRRTTSRASSGCGTSCRACSATSACTQHQLLDHSIYLHKGMPIGATAHQAGHRAVRRTTRRAPPWT